MSNPAHFDRVRIKQGINTKTGKTFWYVEARIAPRKWALISDNDGWVTFPSECGAQRSAEALMHRHPAPLEATELGQ